MPASGCSPSTRVYRLQQIDIDRATQEFTPGAPIRQLDFFRGRLKEINRIRETIPSPGRHPLIFGKRGVGKTSLANVISYLAGEGAMAVKVTCEGSDTFKTIWNRVFEQATFHFRREAFGFDQSEAEAHASLADYLPHNNGISPSDVAGVLDRVQLPRAVFVLDEFDRVVDQATKRQMADLIKIVSDNTPGVTIVVVGVGNNIHELIGEHPSIVRNLAQIEIKEMPDAEVIEVVEKGFDRLQVKAADDVLAEIAKLAAGFPHYAHLLGLATAKACYARKTTAASRKLFDELACPFAVAEAIDSYREAFNTATFTTTRSRYPQFLCACGHAEVDEKEMFRTGDVVTAMSALYKPEVTSDLIKRALGDFCTEDRGRVLLQTKRGRVNYYHFREPMMRPFLRIKAKSLTAN